MCVCVCVVTFCLRQVFSFSESGKHADYEVIDLEGAVEEGPQERVARLENMSV